ncbi:MAG: carbohydrate-binding protein [Thermonemataceae bacterium]
MKTNFYLILIVLLSYSTFQAQTIDPYNPIEGESFDTQNGVQLSNNGNAVGFIQDGDWISFDNVAFGRGPLEGRIRASSNTNGGTVEFRIDSPTGLLIATANITNTNGWRSFQNFDINVLEDYSDGTVFLSTQDLYLVFRGGNSFLLDVDQFSFTSADVIAEEIRITNCPSVLNVGDFIDLEEEIFPANTVNKTVAYSSSNSSVATVDFLFGEVAAVGPGTVTISVTSFSNGLVTDECTFTVVGAGQAVVAYPNPMVDNHINVQLPREYSGEVTYLLQDAVGYTLQEGTVQLDSQAHTMDLTFNEVALSRGVYYLKVKTSDKPVEVIRLMKE